MLGTNFSEHDYIITTCYVIATLLLFNILYWIRYKRLNRQIESSQQTDAPAVQTSLKPVAQITLIVISSVVVWLNLYINNYDLFSLMIRSGELKNTVNMSQAEMLIFCNFIQPMAMITFIIALIFKAPLAVRIVLFAELLLACPLSGISRNAVAAIYLPVLLIMIPWLREKYNFVILYVIGLFVIFPFLNIFRFFEGGTQLLPDLATEEYDVFNEGVNQFSDLNFDAFSMLMRVITNNVITNGRQLLGVLLFFVPRTVWPTKPVGSGNYVANITDLPFENISCPYIAEGYINFGVLGVILFVVIIALFASHTDVKYWKHHQDGNVIDLRLPRYLILISFFLFILRGDLMSSFAYMCGFIFSLFCIGKLILRLNKVK